MAGNTAVLVVEIIGNSSQAVASINATAGSLGRLGKMSAKAAAGMAAAAFATAACVKQASLLEQAEGAVTQIFGEQADVIMEWASGMAAVGLSTSEAAAAAAILGAQLLNVGIPMEQTVVLVQKLVELGTDLAAVFGGTAAQAVGALGAALRGEYESLERYGVGLTAATVEAEALRLANEGLTFASEEQARVVATLSLIYQQTISVQGAAIEESDTLRGSTEALKASLGNLAALIGKILIPIIVPLITAINTVVVAVTEFIQESEGLQAILELVADVLNTVKDILTPELVNAITTIVDAFQRLADILGRVVQPVLEAISSALDAIASAIETVIGWIEAAIDAFQRFVDSIGEAWDALTFWNNNATIEEPTASMAAFRIPAQQGFSVSQLSGATVAPITINIHGAIDPEGTAKAIRRILNTSDNRRGRRIAAL